MLLLQYLSQTLEKSATRNYSYASSYLLASWAANRFKINLLPSLLFSQSESSIKTQHPPA